ncbi:MAG: hypothetical protein HRU22_07185 [Gammaproteobacteria bacterium]|nr:hypothetical protein [Gammaproteobacteria bacterium]
MAISASGIYRYIGLITAKNHPFIGGLMVADTDNWHSRFNINLGYYL